MTTRPPSARPDHATPPQGNRRVHRRPLTCLVWVEDRENPDAHSGIARALDLTSQGMGILTSSDVEPGTSLSVELLVPPTNLILRTTGHVVHSIETPDGFRLGIRFQAPPVLYDTVAMSEPSNPPTR